MSSDLHTERDAFNAFIDSRLSQTSDALNLEAALVEFRAYQRELAEVRAKVQEAKAAKQSGEAEPLDIEELIDEVNNEIPRLA